MGTIHRALAAHAKTNTRVFKRATSNSTPAWGIQKKSQQMQHRIRRNSSQATETQIHNPLGSVDKHEPAQTRCPTQATLTPAHSHPRYTLNLSLHTNYRHSGHRRSEHATESPALRHSRRAIPGPPGTRGLSLEGPRALTCGSLGLGRAELEGERQDQSLSPGHGWGAVAWVLETRSLGDNASGARAGAQGEPEP